ncbi:MAG: hypothetical protein KGM16_02390 [Bacteroidota bacterium]|nr:hypothetical protein [Bacteroidota bacterium]
MKVFRCCVILLASTLFFASCKPNGRILDHDTMKGTPSKADTVLAHKYYIDKSDSKKSEAENEPYDLKR